MDRLIAANSVPAGQADLAPTVGTPQFATSGNPATATPATVFPAYAWNAVQEELIAVITGGGLTPDRTNNAQVASAIRALASISNVQVFLASGTFTVPAGVSAVDVQLWGAGGGGGGCGGLTFNFGSAAGGGGYARRRISGLTPGAAIAVTVGAGGAGGTIPPSSAGTGGTSSFGSYVSATGGGPGLAGTSGGTPGAWGAGGFGVGGDLNVSGQPGGLAWANTTGFCVTGGGGTFGVSMGQPMTAPVPTNGVAGLFPGGGGGGGNTAAGGQTFGGAGAAGLVIVRW